MKCQSFPASLNYPQLYYTSKYSTFLTIKRDSLKRRDKNCWWPLNTTLMVRSLKEKWIFLTPAKPIFVRMSCASLSVTPKIIHLRKSQRFVVLIINLLIEKGSDNPLRESSGKSVRTTVLSRVWNFMGTSMVRVPYVFYMNINFM